MKCKSVREGDGESERVKNAISGVGSFISRFLALIIHRRIGVAQDLSLRKGDAEFFIERKSQVRKTFLKKNCYRA